MPLFDV